MSDNYPLSAQNEIEIYDLSLMATLLFELEPVWCAGIRNRTTPFRGRS